MVDTQEKTRLVSIPDAAVRLGISRKTAYRHCSDGVIKTVWVVGRRMVPETEIIRICTEGTGPNSGPVTMEAAIA